MLLAVTGNAVMQCELRSIKNESQMRSQVHALSPRHPALPRPAQTAPLFSPIPVSSISIPSIPPIPISIPPVSRLRAREANLLPVSLRTASSLSQLILPPEQCFRAILCLGVLQPLSRDPAATGEGARALVNIDKLDQLGVDGGICEGGRLQQGRIDVLALLFQLQKACNLRLMCQLRSFVQQLG